MKLFSLFLYVIILTIRPSETIPFFWGIPVFMISAIVMLGMLFFSLQEVSLTSEIKYFIFFLLCAIFSNISTGWFGGALTASIDMLQLVVAFFAIAVFANNERKLELLIRFFILIGVFLAINSIIQHYYGVGFGGTTPIWDSSKLGGVARAKYSGILDDPNDLGMFMLSIFGLAFALIVHGRWGISRLILLGAAGLILTGMYFTYSRGTYLGVAVVLLVELLYSKKRYKSFIIAGLWLVALPMLPIIITLLGTANSSDESAGGRILAWREGLLMLFWHPLFGVGYNRFTEFHNYTAHNSYVLVMAETGFLGLYGYLGFLYNLGIRMHQALQQESLKNNGLVIGIFSSFIGCIFCMFFLSRAYSPIIFLIFGLSAAALNIWGTSDIQNKNWIKIFLISILLILLIKILIIFSL